jgi:hypothetical protein
MFVEDVTHVLRLVDGDSGARRRRSGGDPGEGCARRPVGTYLYLHAVCACNHVAVPCLTRHGAKRGACSCDQRDQQMSGSLVRRVLEKHNIRTPAHGSPARPVGYVFSASKYSHILFRQRGGGGVYDTFFGKEGYGRINGGTRVLRLAADNWEAALGHGAR